MNIVLIGMPGCGKTTIGKLLAEKLGMQFLCSDEYIELKTNMNICQIFEKYGEQYFRNEEVSAIKEIVKNTNSIISTGGGVVLNEQNCKLLSANGIIVWLQRDVEQLSIINRPLSQNLNTLYNMYDERESLYSKLANITISVKNDTEDTLKELIMNINIHLKSLEV